MAEEVYSAIKRVQIIVRGIAGIKLAPEDPTEALSEFPAAFTYMNAARNVSDSWGDMRTDATLVCDVITPRSNLPINTQTLMPYVDSVTNALREDWIDNHWGSTITELREIRCRLVNMEVNKVLMLGLRFEIDVKIRGTIT